MIESDAPSQIVISEAQEPKRLPQHVILVPGFFGFGRLGDIGYFNGVREALEQNFARLGVEATITEVLTSPTASIRERAARVLETLADVANRDAGPLHLVGHSTGGLDARLAIAPTASLPSGVRFTAHERIRTLVTVCCPHFGTPLATYFTSRLGRAIFRWSAGYLMFMLRRGRLPLTLLLRVFYFIVRLRDPFRKRKGTFDELYEKLLDNLSDQRRLELIEFLSAVSSEQDLLFQLTPAGCDLLNACTAEPGLRYGSVVACARPATFRSLLRSTWDLYSQIMHPVYAILHRIAARAESRLIPEPVGEQKDQLALMLGQLPSARDSDGIVPVHSQVWGSIIHATAGDHLDVVGHFGHRSETAWGGDWIPSYSGFDSLNFAALWSDVARFIEGDSDAARETNERVADQARTARDLPKPV